MVAPRAWLVAFVVIAAAACNGASEPTDVLSPPLCGDGRMDDGEECDDGNAVSGDGCSSTCREESGIGLPVLTVDWIVITLANAPVSCPPMATATVRVEPAGVGAPIIRQFKCDASNAQIPVKSGDYAVQVDILDRNGGVQISSLPEPVTVDATSGTVSATMFVDAGYFAVQWKLVTPQAVTCGDAGVDEIDVVAIDMDGDEHRTAFLCDDDQGLSQALLSTATPYMVHLEALDGLHKLVGMSPVSGKTIGPNNAVTDLGKMDIPIGPQLAP